MSAATVLHFPDRKPEFNLKRVRIMTGVPEDKLFRMFLQRGYALSLNHEIRKMIHPAGYYSVLYPRWSDFEKSISFISINHAKWSSSHVPSLQTEEIDSFSPDAGLPQFTIQLVANRIFLPNEFWGEHRKWLLRTNQSTAIAHMVLEWLEGWNVRAEIETEDPINRVEEITLEARKLRIPFHVNKNDRKAHEQYIHKLKNMDTLIDAAKNDLSVLNTEAK
jgi:hypothetical protein